MRSVKGILVQFLLIFFIMLITSCSSNLVNLVDNGSITLENVNTLDVIFTKLQVFQDNENLVIKGRVKRRYYHPQIIFGYVDVILFSPSGSVVMKKRCEHYPRRLPKSRFDGSRFSICIPIIPSGGSKARIEYHDR